MIVLAQANLTAVTAEHQHVLCAHCAEWSPHCSLLKPQLVEAADRLAAQGVDVLLAMVESRFEDEDQTEPIGTLSWYEDGTRMAYTGGRTASSITQWVQKRLAPKDELRRLAASTAPQQLKTFGTGRSAFRLTATEQTVFEHTLGNGSSGGVMTHFWITGLQEHSWIKGSTDNATVRYYVDGEAQASIEFQPSMAAGVGFDDNTTNWGNSMIGRAGKGGWYNNLKIPFGSSVRVTLALRAPRPATAFVILRGCENLPVSVGALPLPTSARLRLHKIEQAASRRSTRSCALPRPHAACP